MSDNHWQIYSIELFGETMIHLANYLRRPDSPTGNLIITLERLTSALRKEPYQPISEFERQIRLRAMELFAVSHQSVNGPDTNEGRAKLFTLLTELKGEK